MADPARPRLLFITPILPEEGGNGLAMRAEAVLKRFKRDYDVSLLVANPYNPWARTSTTRTDVDVIQFPRWAGLYRRIIGAIHRRWPVFYLRYVPFPIEWNLPSRDQRNFLSQLAQFDVIHIFRLYQANLARPFFMLEPRPRIQLDVDDLESLTRARFSEVLQENEQFDSARHFRSIAAFYHRQEDRWLPRFDQVFVCSHEDRERLANRFPGLDIALMPNSIQLPARTQFRIARPPFNFMFIGGLGYLPNADGVLWFLGEVLPHIQQRTASKFQVDIIGSNPAEAIQHIAASQETVEVHGFVEDLAPFYEQADVMIIPLRAGGGTRTKILEAFAHGRPVISTTLGIEGIQAEPGKHFLLADSTEAFAQACLDLMADPGQGKRLAMAAFELVKQRYQG
jgi:glycosyltransferase involved in cell wall biosynthesis